MSSEMEQLEKEAIKQKATQQMREVQLYMDSILEKIAERLIEERRAGWIWLFGWLVWLGSSFMGLGYIGILAFLCGLIYQHTIERRVSRAFGELYGALKILELLGLADGIPLDGDKRKRKTLHEMASMVKGWVTKKKEVQEKVYSPA